jgi:hypothetical protein
MKRRRIVLLDSRREINAAVKTLALPQIRRFAASGRTCRVAVAHLQAAGAPPEKYPIPFRCRKR